MIKCVGGPAHGKSVPDYGPTMYSPGMLSPKLRYSKTTDLSTIPPPRKHEYRKVWKDDYAIYLYQAEPIKSLNGWSCLLTAAAMAFGSDPDDIINFIGHNGSQQGTYGDRRGFHMQEIARFAYCTLGINLCPIEPGFAIQTPNGDYFQSTHSSYFHSRLNKQPAILEGRTWKCGHANYWDGYKIIDSRGDSDDFTILRAWLII